MSSLPPGHHGAAALDRLAAAPYIGYSIMLFCLAGLPLAFTLFTVLLTCCMDGEESTATGPAAAVAAAAVVAAAGHCWGVTVVSRFGVAMGLGVAMVSR